MGIGNKFIKPKLILIKAIKEKNDIKPVLAADPAIIEICIGPPILSALTLPNIIFLIDSRISKEKFRVWSTALMKEEIKSSLV